MSTARQNLICVKIGDSEAVYAHELRIDGMQLIMGTETVDLADIDTPPIVMLAADPEHSHARCTGCGRFLRSDSTYVNKCSDCWTTEDDFI